VGAARDDASCAAWVVVAEEYSYARGRAAAAEGTVPSPLMFGMWSRAAEGVYADMQEFADAAEIGRARSSSRFAGCELSGRRAELATLVGQSPRPGRVARVRYRPMLSGHDPVNGRASRGCNWASICAAQQCRDVMAGGTRPTPKPCRAGDGSAPSSWVRRRAIGMFEPPPGRPRRRAGCSVSSRPRRPSSRAPRTCGARRQAALPARTTGLSTSAATLGGRQQRVGKLGRSASCDCRRHCPRRGADSVW
jgi:hypothetical protein